MLSKASYFFDQNQFNSAKQIERKGQGLLCAKMYLGIFIQQDITVSPKVHDEILKLEDERDIVIRTGGKTGHTQESVIIFPLIFLSLGIKFL